MHPSEEFSYYFRYVGNMMIKCKSTNIQNTIDFHMNFSHFQCFRSFPFVYKRNPPDCRNVIGRIRSIFYDEPKGPILYRFSEYDFLLRAKNQRKMNDFFFFLILTPKWSVYYSMNNLNLEWFWIKSLFLIDRDEIWTKSKMKIFSFLWNDLVRI